MHAVVIDDSLTIRYALAAHLMRLGFDASMADGGLAGLERLAVDPVPDLICIDWNMPDLPGYEVLQALRQDPRLAQAKVMMVTSESDLALMQLAMQAGADEYLMKPFSPDSLRAKLELLGLVQNVGA